MPRPSRAGGRPCPPRNTGGRGCWMAGGSTRAPTVWKNSPSNVSGSPPSRPVTIWVASRRRRMRSPGGGIAMPMAAYSGSYHPAPRPTSRRPPVRRSSVARALAATAGGRSASQSTSVPSRTRSTTPASAPSVAIGSNAPHGFGRAAVLADVEEEVVGDPQGVVARGLGTASVLGDRVEHQRRLTRDGVVVLGKREPDPHLSQAIGSRQSECSRARVCARTCRRAATSRRSTRSRRACSPSLLDRHQRHRSPPIRLHARRPRPEGRRDGRGRARTGRGGAARPDRARGRAPALRDARRRPLLSRSTRTARSRPPRPSASPSGPRPISSCPCSSTTTPTRCGARSRSCAPRPSRPARPTSDPARPHPTLGAVAVGARPPLVAVNCWLDTDDLLIAREIARDGARAGRRPARRAGARARARSLAGVCQVSMNLVDLPVTGIEAACTEVRRLAERDDFVGDGGRDRGPDPGGRARAHGAPEFREWAGLSPTSRSRAAWPGGRPEPWRRVRPAATRRRSSARWRRTRRRSRSERPPQIPNFSPWARAYSRHSTPDLAAPADALGLSGRGAPLREEQVGIDPEAVRPLLPPAGQSASPSARADQLDELGHLYRCLH